jgi:peptide deformylase
VTESTEYKPKTRTILFYPDQALNLVSEPIEYFGKGVALLGRDLNAPSVAPNAEGISAPQVGVRARVIVVKTPEGYLTMVNPQYRPETPEKVLLDEGCLSFPGAIEKVERWKGVEVAYMDLLGNVQTVTMQHDQGGHAVQHECEHLDGKLLIEHLPLHRRDRLRTKMKKLGRLTTKVEKKMRVAPTQVLLGYTPGA